MQRSIRFAQNIGWNVLAQAGAFAVNLWTIPVLVRWMGTERYGLYILLYTVANYLLLLTMGSGPAIIKYVAEFSAAEDGPCLRETLKFGGSFHAFGVLAGSLVLYFSAPYFASAIFHVPQQLLGPGTAVLRGAAAGAFFVALTQFALCSLQGLQRFDWNTSLVLALNVLMPLGAVAAFALGKGLRAVACWYVALNATVGAVALAALARLVSRLRLRDTGKAFSLRTFGLYSLSMASGAAATVVAFQLDKVLIANALSLAELTLYAIPSGILQRLQILPATISTVLVPLISGIGDSEAGETLPPIYLKSVRVLLWTTLPALVMLFALMPQLLTLWLGGEFGRASVWPARLLVLAQLFLLLNYIPNSVAAARGKPWYIPAVAWAEAALSLVAWKLLISRWGLLGVAAGSLLAQILPTVFYLLLVHRRILRLSTERYLEKGLLVPFASAGLLLALLFPLHPLASTWPRLIALCAAGGALYYGSTWLLLDAEDRAFIRRYLRWQPR